jgi:glycosyltransferase involved in cell wall biosynthesis/tRNA A-37 threonylcarbamoyl transferase component Bud32
MKKPRLSACIITHNEEGSIRDCLESVRFADEVVVVDSYSTDGTRDICKQYTDKVFQRKWEGHVKQKNLAIAEATGEWILGIDADERVSSELAQEIREELERNAGDVDGYIVSRHTFYLGKWIDHGAWYPDYKLRLFRRGRGRWGGTDPHDKVIVPGKTKTLRGKILHFVHKDLSDQLKTVDSFSTITAQNLASEGKTFGLGLFLFKPPIKFFETYVLKRGFLDGLPGFIISMVNSFYIFLKYAKLWELRRNATKGRLPPGEDAKGKGMTRLRWETSRKGTELAPQDIVERLHKANGSKRILRDNPVRTSFILSDEEDERPIFVKKYKYRGTGDKAKYFFLPSKAKSEWKALNRFQKWGIPVPAPIAFGDGHLFTIPRESYLITKVIPDAIPLNEWAGDARGASSSKTSFRSRCTAARKLGHLVREIHEKGVLYRDLHAGNILVAEGDSAEPSIYFIDLHKAYKLNRVPLHLRIRDLAQLANSLSTSRAMRWRFLKAYGQRGNGSQGDLKEIAHRTVAKAENLWRVHLKSRTKRCLINSSQFGVTRERGWKLYFNRTFEAPSLVDLVERFKKRGWTKLLKDTPKSSVATLPFPTQSGTLTLCVKRVKGRGILALGKALLKKDRARRSWVGTHGMRVRGISAPEPVALIEKPGLGLNRESYLLTTFLEGVKELNSYVIERFDRPLSLDNQKEKESFITSLAKRLSDLHHKGIYHADLKSNNILVKEEGPLSWEFYFIDCDRVRFKSELNFKELSNNLAQINASISSCMTPSDRLRFFKDYARGDISLLLQRKRFYRKILEISRGKITHPYGVQFTPAPGTGLPAAKR